MSLRRSSAGIGRGNQPIKNESPLKISTIAKDIFFDEWMPEKDEKPSVIYNPELQEIQEERESQAWSADNTNQNEKKIKQRFLEYYVTLQASKDCLFLPIKKLSSPTIVIENALKYYNAFSKKNYSLCGSQCKIPCIIQIGGVLACAEFERLSLNPNFSKWIVDLTDLTSGLCVIANKLASESNFLVRCWWSSENQCFVLFCRITTISQAIEIVEEKNSH